LRLTIDKLIYGGDGLGRLPADEKGPGKAVFVPFVLAGEEVEAKPVAERPGFVRATLDHVIAPSALRVAPACPYFGQCGGCHYQHTSYDDQLRIKAGILAETVQRIAKIDLASAFVGSAPLVSSEDQGTAMDSAPGGDPHLAGSGRYGTGSSGTARLAIHIHPSPPWNYRNRARFRVRGGARFAVGYNRFGSHEVLAVEQCPISSPLINRALASLWEQGRAGRVPESLREAQLFANHDDSSLLIEFSIADCRDARRDNATAKFEELAGLLRARVPELVGVALFPAGASEEDLPAAKRAPRVLPHGATRPRISADSNPEPLSLYGTGETIYRTTIEPFRVGPGSFFQTNRFLVDKLVEIVTAGARGDLALDLYAGVGLFSVALARSFARVIAVESSPFSFRDLRRNAGRNVKPVQATTEKFLERPRGIAPEFVVVDPPRTGMGERVSRAVAALGAARIAYVSCDPATFARDLRALADVGYRVRQAHLVDLFPQTFHVESVWHLERIGK
jgi:23S rRNA (uracil1939-C5)-methyltransferase